MDKIIKGINYKYEKKNGGTQQNKLDKINIKIHNLDDKVNNLDDKVGVLQTDIKQIKVFLYENEKSKNTKKKNND